MHMPRVLSTAALLSLCVSPIVAYACGNVMRFQDNIPSTEAWLVSGPIALFSILALQRHKPLPVAHQLAWVVALATIPNLLIMLFHPDPKWILLGISDKGAFGLFVFAITLMKILAPPAGKHSPRRRKAINFIQGFVILAAAVVLALALERSEPMYNYDRHDTEGF